MTRTGQRARRAPVGSWGAREAGILDVARRLFLANGYEKTSMASVAMAAGLSEGTLYNYFRNKIDLVLQVTLASLEQRADEAARAVDEASSLREGLEALLRLHIDAIIRDEEIYRIWLREVRGGQSYRRSADRDTLARFANQLPRLFAKFGVPDLTATGLTAGTMRDLVFGGSEQLAFTAIVQQRALRIDIPTTARQLAEIYLRGFGLLAP